MTQQQTNGQPTKALAPIDEVRNNLSRMGDQFKAVLPTQQHVDRFIRVVMTAVQQNPELLEADRRTFYAACMRCAQDGLLPDGKEAFLNVRSVNIARRDEPARWQKQVQYEPMVEGLLKKVRNSGQIKGAPKVHIVREHDDFDYQLGDEEKIVHKPAKRNRGNIVGAYSIVTLLDGETSREYMDIDEIMQVREKSKAKDSGPWRIPKDGVHTTEFGEQCRKTVFRRHYKKLPKSTDLDNVLKSDDETYDMEQPPAAPLKDVSPQPAETEPQGKRRPKALDKVVEAAKQPAETPTAAEPQVSDAEIVEAQTGAQPTPPPADII